MIPKETIDNIFESAHIEEVVGDYVVLKKRGANMLGLCPFHDEKTPSFTVSPAKGIYKCFGCGKGGNSVNFVMDHEHFSYPEALRHLAKRFGIEVEEEEMSPEQQQEYNERESLYIVSQFAEDYFVKQLHESEEGQAIGLSYFKERGFTEETIKKFKLGYSPDSWEAFSDAAKSAGYKEEYLKATGLSKEKNGKLFDGYKGRVIFPIHNLSGRPIGFGGRTLKTDKRTPKYINSPECEIYNKRKVLYGIFYARKGIAQDDNCYLVEGYTDVISMHQAGVENVVASSGTSLTPDQIRLISRYTKNITILFDGDTAGIKASFRGIDLILEEGMNVKVVLFPEGADPDSYAKSHTTEQLKEFIEGNAKDFLVFKTDLLLSDTEGDPIKKAALIREIVASIAIIPDFITRSVYVKECSAILDIPEEALINELNKTRKNQLNKRKPGRAPHPDEPPFFDPGEQSLSPTPAPRQGESKSTVSYQELDLVRVLLLHGPKVVSVQVLNEQDEQVEQEVRIADFIISEILGDQLEMEDALHGKIVAAFVEAQEQGEVMEGKKLVNHEDEAIRELCTELLSDRHELHNWEKRDIFVEGEDKKLLKMLNGVVSSYKAARVHQLRDENAQMIKEAAAKGEDVIPLIQKKMLLDSLLSSLSTPQGRTVIR